MARKKKADNDVDGAKKAVKIADDGAVEIDLEQSLTIAEVGEWHSNLLSQCDAEKCLILNGGDLEMVDGAGLQLLVALMKEMVERQVTVSWSSSSETLKLAAQSIGLSDVLGLDETSVEVDKSAVEVS